MEELSFKAVFAVFGMAIIGIVAFTSGRRLRFKSYLVPVIAGFIFGLLTDIFFATYIYSFVMGGILTGYMLKEPGRWAPSIRAGGLNATLILAYIYIPNYAYVLQTPLADILEAMGGMASEQVLATFVTYLAMNSFVIVALVILGAVVGGYLRRIIRPIAGNKEEEKENAAPTQNPA